MYAFKDPLPYAYVLILVILPNLIAIYLFYSFYLFKLNLLASVNGTFRIHVKSKPDNRSALEGEKTARMNIYHATTSGTFNRI